MAKKKKKPLEIGTIIKERVVRRYEAYDLIYVNSADGDWGSVSWLEYRTKAGDRIMIQHRYGRRPALLKFILKKGIYPEKAHTHHTNCSIGRAPDGKWYGWSHRAIFGFKVRKSCVFSVKGAEKNLPFNKTTKRLIITEQGAKKSAIRFAKYVS